MIFEDSQHISGYGYGSGYGCGYGSGYGYGDGDGYGDGYGYGNGHIFNLGHGILPDIDPEKVKALVRFVKDISTEYHKKGSNQE